MKLLRCIALFAAFTGNAFAILPDNGWYWNPNESGRGFNIEIQNNVLFMAGFVYDPNGVAIWVVTGGPMSSDRFYSGSLVQTSGGQCIGCSYRAPQNNVFGSVTVNFTDEQHAIVTVNGTALSLQREPFGVDFTNQATPLLGEWATTEGSVDFPLYFGDRLSFVTTFSSNGVAAGGNRTGDASRVVVGQYIPGTGWGMLLDASTSYYKVYSFTFTGFNRMQGIESTFPKTGSPTGYSDFVADRIQSAVAAAGGNGPGVVKAAVHRDALDAAQAARDATSPKRAPAALIELANQLRALITR